MMQIDVMNPANARWKMIYEFDTPVVRITDNTQLRRSKLLIISSFTSSLYQQHMLKPTSRPTPGS